MLHKNEFLYVQNIWKIEYIILMYFKIVCANFLGSRKIVIYDTWMIGGKENVLCGICAVGFGGSGNSAVE